MRLISIDGPQKQLERLAYLLNTEISQHYLGYKLFVYVFDDCPVFGAIIKGDYVSINYSPYSGAKRRMVSISMNKLVSVIKKYQSYMLS
jgi:hypothetical protein